MSPREVEQLLERIEHMQPVSDAELEALEVHLGNDPALAERCGGQRPTRPETAYAVQQPSQGTWNRVWGNVVEQSAPTKRQMGIGWQPLAAAACVALLALTLRFSAPLSQTMRPAADNWELSLATGVTVDELESYGDTTTFVSYQGDFDDPAGTTMIWILPGEDDAGV